MADLLLSESGQVFIILESHTGKLEVVLHVIQSQEGLEGFLLKARNLVLKSLRVPSLKGLNLLRAQLNFSLLPLALLLEPLQMELQERNGKDGVFVNFLLVILLDFELAIPVYPEQLVGD